MNYWCFKNSAGLLAIALVVSLCVFLSGCAAPTVEKAPRICPDKSIDQVLQVFKMRRQRARPLRAGGNLNILWYDSEEKARRENLTVDLRFCPPDRIYFRGNTVLGEAVRVGANSDEFWVLMKPDEISTYQWGRCSNIQKCPGRQWLSPGILLEALSAPWADSDWSISREGDSDVLTRTGEKGSPVQKIYFNCSNYLPEKIEYYDSAGQPALVLKLDKYTTVGDSAPLPAKINITHYETNTTADITLKNVKLFEPSPKQLKGLFARPETKGFESVFRLDQNCEFVEQ